jgi:hypothetical protein
MNTSNQKMSWSDERNKPDGTRTQKYYCIHQWEESYFSGTMNRTGWGFSRKFCVSVYPTSDESSDCFEVYKISGPNPELVDACKIAMSDWLRECSMYSLSNHKTSWTDERNKPDGTSQQKFYCVHPWEQENFEGMRNTQLLVFSGGFGVSITKDTDELCCPGSSVHTVYVISGPSPAKVDACKTAMSDLLRARFTDSDSLPNQLESIQRACCAGWHLYNPHNQKCLDTPKHLAQIMQWMRMK